MIQTIDSQNHDEANIENNKLSGHGGGVVGHNFCNIKTNSGADTVLPRFHKDAAIRSRLWRESSRLRTLGPIEQEQSWAPFAKPWPETRSHVFCLLQTKDWACGCIVRCLRLAPRWSRFEPYRLNLLNGRELKCRMQSKLELLRDELVLPESVAG